MKEERHAGAAKGKGGKKKAGDGTGKGGKKRKGKKSVESDAEAERLLSEDEIWRQYGTDTDMDSPYIPKVKISSLWRVFLHWGFPKHTILQRTVPSTSSSKDKPHTSCKQYCTRILGR